MKGVCIGNSSEVTSKLPSQENQFKVGGVAGGARWGVVGKFPKIVRITGNFNMIYVLRNGKMKFWCTDCIEMILWVWQIQLMNA